ncbi:immunity protein YezG family protein [Massilia aquatica]|uniref:DUF600 family protein n=1 Tax=Massilia aquatica TaxID=2609000 RepID=A0ABX0MBW7_9BURK|nr:immunity protein YezG family protein [Massilia aquatica]NHZ44153.1 DUF600 family protein [Massilia aquatica]
MVDPDQFEIMQKIVDDALTGVESGWQELIITYHVDDEMSDFVSSYIVEEGGGIMEKSARMTHQMDRLLRELRKDLAQRGKPLFSRLRLHLFANGKFDTSYGYDDVDWPALFKKDWQFFPGSGFKKSS